MIKNCMRYKIILISVLLAIFLSFLIIYSKVKNSCTRSYTIELKQRIEEYRNVLIKDYNPEKISFITQDGIKLSGLFIDRPKSEYILLICHGRKQSKELLLPLIKLFNNMSIFVFDFRGHGQSGGNLITFGYHEYKDVLAAYNYITKNLSNKPVIGLGISMGSAALLKAAYSGAHFKALIIDSGFGNLYTELMRCFKAETGLPDFLSSIGNSVFNIIASADSYSLDNCKYLNALDIPVLIIHSASDTLVPVADAYKLFNCAHEPKELFIVDNTRHAGIFKVYPQQYTNKISKFIELISAH